MIALQLGHGSCEFLTTLRTSVHPEKGNGTLQMYKDVKVHSEEMKRQRMKK
jgi:hypothetical protein